MADPKLGDAAGATESALVGQVVDFVRWIDGGRKLTQTGALTLADSRTLVDRLGTRDQIDPAIGGRVFKTKSSTELLHLSLIVEWAKAAGLVRVVRGRLVPVKKGAVLLDRPMELWTALFDAFGKLGPAFLPTGWGESLLRNEFDIGSRAMLSAMHRQNGPIALTDLGDVVWNTVTARYVLDGATDVQLSTARRINDRDVRRALWVLADIGAVATNEDTAELTELGRSGIRRQRGEPEPGDAVHQISVTLTDVADPMVWRRLLIPSAMPLSGLHQVIQTAMGWEECHLHSFTNGVRTYGPADRELRFIDESSVRFGDLDFEDVVQYTYDFGDDWVHDIVVERVGVAEPGEHYPRCVGGEGACPPEDCGGPPGYEHLRQVLASPGDVEHAEMVTWLGLEQASEFDPAAFAINAVNSGLAALGAAERRR